MMYDRYYLLFVLKIYRLLSCFISFRFSLSYFVVFLKFSNDIYYQQIKMMS